MKLGIVIAGNYRQFIDWVGDRNPNEYIYAFEPEHLMGIHGLPIIITGEYWRNKLHNSDDLLTYERTNKINS